MRPVPTLCLAGALVVGLHAPAVGHAELVPWQLPPGASAGLTLLVTHGCGDEEEWISSEPLVEEPTVAVTVQAPLELRIEPRPVDGWPLSTERDASGQVVSATWRSEDPGGTADTLQLPIDVRVADVADGTDVWLPVIQECTGGEELSWTLEGDTRGGDEIPAMRLTVAEDATAPPTWGEGPVDAAAADAETARPSAPLTPLGGVSAGLALLGAAGLGVALRRRRRAGSDPTT